MEHLERSQIVEDTRSREQDADPATVRQGPTSGQTPVQRPSRAVDLSGLRFGSLSILDRAPNTGSRCHARWWARCDCGELTAVSGSHLRRRNMKACAKCTKKRLVAEARAKRSPMLPNGKTRAQLAAEVGISAEAMAYRIEKGWSAEDLMLPSQNKVR